MKIYVENPEPDLDNGDDLYFVAKVSYRKRNKDYVAFYAIANDRRSLDATIRMKEERYFPGLLTCEGCDIEKKTMHLSKIELTEDFINDALESQEIKEIRGIKMDQEMEFNLDLTLCPIRETTDPSDFIRSRDLLVKDEIMFFEGMNEEQSQVLYLTENFRKPVWDLDEALYNALSAVRFPELESFLIEDSITNDNSNVSNRNKMKNIEK
ncbi:MAG: hypothetical protein GF329_21455 [Candidatus Lokiarchaeota archaeon]|nr:hypothetical protein [Candidatus Lokiarchaeota archaeon]